MQGRPGFRVRVGDYRINYTIADDVLLVVVVTLGHRRDVYRTARDDAVHQVPLECGAKPMA